MRPPATPHSAGDRIFFIALAVIGGSYVLLVAAMVLADASYSTPGHLLAALRSPEIRASLQLSLISCSLAAALSVIIAVPLGYLLARTRFFGKWLVELLVDIPVVLPPLVVGLSLLMLFQVHLGGRSIQDWCRYAGFEVVYAVPAVVLAQFAVAAAFAVRTLRITFVQIPRRTEDVARTLGCSRAGAFLSVTLPQARRGVFAAFTLAWARSLGEFGPILIFAGATRGRTEVLSTTVFLELSVGNLEAAVAVSLIMMAVAAVVLGIVRWLGKEALVSP